MAKATIDKAELESMGFKRNQARTILHDARQVMVKRGKPFWGNPRLTVAPRGIVEEVILGCSLTQGEDHDKN